MGVHYLLYNYTRMHDFNVDWCPRADHVQQIGKALGWNLSTDVIVVETDCDSWGLFVDNGWVWHTYDSKRLPKVAAADLVLDHTLDALRDSRGFLTIDVTKLDKLCDDGRITDMRGLVISAGLK